MENEIRTTDKINQNFAFILTTITVIVVLIVLNGIKNDRNIDLILQNYNLNIDVFLPEKSERLQYMIGTVGFPIFYITYYLILSRVKYYQNSSELYNILISFGFIIGLLSSLIIILNNNFYLEYFKYFENPFSNIIFAILILYLVLFLICIYENLNKNVKKINIILFTLSIFMITRVSNLFITNTYYYNNFFVSHHFDAYYYPVYKVYSGETPLVDFNSLYGFYPYFLVPFLKLTGGISMKRFSYVMAGLVFIALLSVTIAIYSVSENKFVAFLGNLALNFAVVIYPMLYQGDYYLQYIPHRVLFPMLIVLVCIFSLRVKSNKGRTIFNGLGYLLSIMSLLWNIETGFVVIIAFFAFQLYELFLEYNLNTKDLWIGVLKQIIFAVLSVVVAIIILYLITYIRTGEIISMVNILISQITFYGLGFYMIKMPLIHPWIILVSIYAVALIKALQNIKFLRKSKLIILPRAHLSLYFVLPIIGMGIFSYYQGRSHLYTFPLITWPGIILLILFIQEHIYLYKAYKNDVSKKNRVICCLKIILVLLVISSYAFAMIINLVSPNIISVAKKSTKVIESSELTPILNEINTIRSEDEDIDIVAFHAAAIYTILRDTDIANVPATVDWYTKDDYNKVIDYISKTNNKLIIDRASYDLLTKYKKNQLDQSLLRFSIINETEAYISYQPNNK